MGNETSGVFVLYFLFRFCFQFFLAAIWRSARVSNDFHAALCFG